MCFLLQLFSFIFYVKYRRSHNQLQKELNTHVTWQKSCRLYKKSLSVLNAAFSFAEVHFGSINLLKESGLTNTFLFAKRSTQDDRD